MRSHHCLHHGSCGAFVWVRCCDEVGGVYVTYLPGYFELDIMNFEGKVEKYRIVCLGHLSREDTRS